MFAMKYLRHENPQKEFHITKTYIISSIYFFNIHFILDFHIFNLFFFDDTYASRFFIQLTELNSRLENCGK